MKVHVGVRCGAERPAQTSRHGRIRSRMALGAIATVCLLASAPSNAAAAPHQEQGEGAAQAVGGQFAVWAQAPGVTALSGDVNKDGRADIILTGGSGWNTVPVAFSRGDGSFRVTNEAVASVPGWAQGAGVKALAGDVNKNGRADIMLTGGSGWNTVPVAFSRGDGSFRVTNEPVD